MTNNGNIAVGAVRGLMPGFYRLSVSERLRLMLEREILSEDDYHRLMDQQQRLDADAADRMIENVIGVLGLPMSLGLNFLINGRDYLVPLAVEEASITAAMSSAAKICRNAGGITAVSDESLLIGQVQLVGLPTRSRTRAKIMNAKDEILDLANSLHPRMVARGGGAKDLEVRCHRLPSGKGQMVVVHLLVDTRDAMGANLVNTMCEGVAPLLEKITGGTVFLRILSNLTDRALVKATVSIAPELLGTADYDGRRVRDGIVLANDFARIDAYRAATHNKGIMNGIDAVAIATGNDWRAIEAAAHAYAGRGDGYTALTEWYVGESGNLEGVLEMPLKVGIIGGSTKTNPACELALRLVNVKSAQELAQVMVSAGLAQNLAALRALSTEGIQRGHMTLHARSCAIEAGAPESHFNEVVERLVQDGQIKAWRAKEIVKEVTMNVAPKIQQPQPTPLPDDGYAAGHGKVIILGEHAVVYGSHAIAAPIPLAVQAKATAGHGPSRLLIPRWGVETELSKTPKKNSVQESLDLILRRLDVRERSVDIEVYPHVPRAMGLGGSASMAVAIIRAISRHFDLGLNDVAVNALALECEGIAHGTPSGLDNTLATYGQFILFKRSDPPMMEPIPVKAPIQMVVGITGIESLTAKTVADVKRARDESPEIYDRIFAEIDKLTLEGLAAIKAHDLPALGRLMNICQGQLNSLGVSSRELEELIDISRKAGALGAKLTGGGGGGSMIALCPDDTPETADNIAAAMREAGYRALITEIG